MSGHRHHRAGNGGAASGARLVGVAALTLVALALYVTGARAEPAGDAQAKRAPESALRSRHGLFAAAQWAKLDACHREHEATYPGLSVNTTASFFARGDKVVFVLVDLPEAPLLARCLEREIEGWTVSDPPPWGMRGDDVSAGAISVELGPVRRALKFKSAAQLRERLRRMTEEALARGVLRETDPIVQEQRRRELARTPTR